MATFRQIEIFLKLAGELHFNRAAQQLEITQAALSKEINKLEKSLGCSLFDRSDKWNIALTDAGRAYLEKVKDIPELLFCASEHAQRAFRGERGSLSISVANMVYDHLQLGGILRKMHEKYPEVKILVRDCQSSPNVYDQVYSGESDIGFLAVNNLGSPEQNLLQRKLLEVPILFAIPEHHPLAEKPVLQITDFRNANFILPSEKNLPWLRKQFDSFFYEHCGKLPLVEQEVLGMHATRQLVSAGLGIGLLAKPGTVDKREKIVYRSTDFPLKRIIIAAWDGENQSKALKNFLKMLPEPEKILR